MNEEANNKFNPDKSFEPDFRVRPVRTLTVTYGTSGGYTGSPQHSTRAEVVFEPQIQVNYGPLYNGFLHMTDNMLGPSPIHIKYSSYVYDGFCI